MAVVAQLSNLAPGPLSFGCMIKIIDTKSVCRVGNVGRCELRLTNFVSFTNIQSLCKA